MEDANSCHGLVTLHVGKLLDLGLNVIRDPLDTRKLLITNMPLTNPGDKDQEAILEAVASIARIETRYKWQRPEGKESAQP